MEEVTEELVPEEHEASGERSLDQAGGQALEEAPGAFLLEHLPDEVQEAPVAPHLGRKVEAEEEAVAKTRTAQHKAAPGLLSG